MLKLDRLSHLVFASLVLTLLAAPAVAHHGRDFLLTQSAHLPKRGEIYANARQDYVDDGHEKEWEFEPAVIAAVADWMTLELHSHIEIPSGESAEYESTAAMGQFRFTPRESVLALGASLEYELARHGDAKDVWAFSGIASYESTGWIIGLNLRVERETSGAADTEWGYAAGARRALSAKLAAGLEISGSLEAGRQGELLLGVYAEPTSWLTMNVGLGTGFNDGADVSFRSAIIFKLR